MPNNEPTPAAMRAAEKINRINPDGAISCPFWETDQVEWVARIIDEQFPGYQLGGKPRPEIDWDRVKTECDDLCDEGDMNQFGFATMQHCVQRQLGGSE